MTAAHAIGLAILAGTWLICAWFLLVSRVRLAGIMLGAGGLTIVLWLVLRSPSSDLSLPSLLVGLLFAPLAIVAYPRFPSTRPAVDWASVGATVLVAAFSVGLSPDHSAYLLFLTVAVVVLHLWWRFERLEPTDRQPLIWLGIGLGTCAVLAFATGFVLPQSSQVEALLIVSLGLPAVCMVVGARRPDIVDATGIVVEATVLGVTALVCTTLYVTAWSLLTMAAGRSPGVGIQAVLAVSVAAAFHPVKGQLHSTIDELLFGRRPDPLTAVAQVAGAPTLDTATILERVRGALVIPYAAIRTARADGEEVAVSGDPTPHVRVFPLRPDAGGDGREVLVAGLRQGDLQFSRADCEVLALVARLLGQMLRSEALADELARSRAAIQGAVEEERMRLRRDLHDGLGPTLTGIAFTADAVGNLASTHSEQVHDLVCRLRGEATAAIAEIRRIVYDMRPPVLDHLGLCGALAQAGETLERIDLEIVITVDEDLGELPPALEVTAYRIVTEALTNVARHTSSTRVVVELTRDGPLLSVRVSDDCGQTTGDWPVGVGLTSMRERTEQMGGTLRVGPTPAGGLVEAHLPLT